MAAPEVTDEARSANFFNSIVQSVHDVFIQKNLRTLMFIFIVTNMIGGALPAVLNVTLASLPKNLLIGNFGFSTVVVSFGFSFGMIIGNLTNITFISKRTLPQLVTVVLLLMGLLAIDFMTMKNVYIAAVIFASLAFFLGNIGPKFSAMIITSLDDTHLAASLGALNSVLTLSIPVTTAGLLLIANLFSVFTAWVTVIILVVIVLFTTTVLSNSLKKTPDLVVNN
jgi:hypothetical protein